MNWLWVVGYVVIGVLVALVVSRVSYEPPDESILVEDEDFYERMCEEASREAAHDGLMAGVFWLPALIFFLCVAPFYFAYDALVAFAGGADKKEREARKGLEEAERIVSEHEKEQEEEWEIDYKKLEDEIDGEK